MELPKHYNSDDSESKWGKYWENKGIYKFDPKSKKKLYSVDTPPPTVSGKIHMGHAFSYTQADMIVRFKRMQGFNIFYPFGFDDNGLATGLFVEKKHKVSSRKMGRDAFVKLCLEETKNSEKVFKELWTRISISADWSLEYSTISPKVQRISQRSFIELYKNGREYRKEAPTFWCPKCRTAASQVELEDKDIDSFFNDLDFKLKDGGKIKIATTRPELLAACVSIFVHPEDKRYKKLVGKKAIVPLFGQEVTILSDEKADPEKGTGAVMCCTFGDQNDIDWWYAHKLPLRVAISKNGVMTEISGKYEGMKIEAARKEIIEDLKKDGALTGQKPITHAVNVHERCGTAIEFLVTKQWFIKVLDMKKELLTAGNKMSWYPKHMKVRYDNWTNGLSWDWCISRQRFYGVPFPIWYCKDCGEIILADESQLPVNPFVDKPKNPCPKCKSKNYIPEEDTLDTWATSSLTPLINARWGEKDEIKDIYPMDLRPQAHDIITFWLFNTVVKGILHKKQVPFKNIMISGHALDPKGKKMSKSKGNVILPQTILEKFSADALRFWAAGSKLGDDLPYQEKDVLTGNKMATKMWNASKFAIMHLEDYDGKDAKLEPIDKWVLSKLNDIIDISTKSLEKYEYAKAKIVAERFFFDILCDNYLEMAKDRLYNPDVYGKESRRAAQFTLYNALLGVLKLIAPIMPYITEEIYHLYFAKKEGQKSIHISSWPEVNKKWADKKAVDAGNAAADIIAAIRQHKSSNNLSLNTPYDSATIDTKDKSIITPIESTIKGTMKIGDINYGKLSKPDIELEIGKNPIKIKMGNAMPKEK